MTNKIKFILNGCDISFIAEAPEDMTVKQLVEQASRIQPYWCACGICRAEDDDKVEICFDYNNVMKVDDLVACSIKEKNEYEIIEEKCKPGSCDECMYHQVDGLFDYGMLLMDDNTNYEKQRDPQCPLN